MKSTMPAGSDLELELAESIRAAAPEVVRKVIDKAKEGSYLHAKFLFDFAGLDLKRGSQDEEDSAANESLAAYLLRELKEPADGSAAG